MPARKPFRLDEIRKAIDTPTNTDTPTTNDLVTHPCEGRLSTPKDNTHTTTLALDDTHEIECGGAFKNLPPGMPKGSKLNNQQINIKAFNSKRPVQEGGKDKYGLYTTKGGRSWHIEKDKDGHGARGGNKAYKLFDDKGNLRASLNKDGWCVQLY